MNIALIGSGSGGHIYPCISFYKEAIKSHNCICFVFKKIDEEIYKNQYIDFIKINNKLSSFKQIIELRKQFKKNSIDCLVTFGGKVSFLAILAAKSLGIKIYMCEQNVIFGKANSIGRIFVNKIFLAFPIKENKKYLYVGNPVVENLNCKKFDFFKTSKPTILLVCGSLGSSTILNVFADFISKHNEYNFIVVLGKNNHDSLIKNDNVMIFDYYEPLKDLLNSVDVVISRAGASTLSEIIALNVLSILIPSPYVTNNHQYKNAKFLLDKNACQMIQEKDLNETIINSYILNYLNNPYYCYQVKENMKKLKVNHPCKKMLEVIEKDLNE